MGDLIFGGMDFELYGVEVDGVDEWVKPERDTTAIHVPGRSGDLIIDNGCWNNVDITYHCLIKDGWASKFPDFVQELYHHQGGYEMLYYTGSYGSQGGRMAEFRGGINPKLWFAIETGAFDLTFNCKPQIYVLGGSQDADFTSADDTLTFDNSYGMRAFPHVHIYNASSGARVLWNGGGGKYWTIDVAANGYDIIDIDCELEMITAYDEFDEENAVNANSIVTITPDPGTAEPFPFFDPALGLTVKFLHTYVGNTYTGTAGIDPRFTRI